MNDNMTLKTRAIDEYKRQYLEGMTEYKGGKVHQVGPPIKVPS